MDDLLKLLNLAGNQEFKTLIKEVYKQAFIDGVFSAKEGGDWDDEYIDKGWRESSINNMLIYEESSNG